MATVAAPIDATSTAAWKALEAHQEKLEAEGIDLKAWYSVFLIVQVAEELMRTRLFKNFIFMVALKLTRVALEQGAQFT